MNKYAEKQINALAAGISLLEDYFAELPDMVTDLASLRQTIGISRIDQFPRVGNDSETSLKIAISLRTAVEFLDDEAAQRARPILVRAEQAVAADIRARIASKLNGIYVIVDPEATRGRPVSEVARQSLEGGARIVQLRDKLNDKGDILKSARELKTLCDEYDALFVMNDHADLARASDAHVLHVGQTDLPVQSARDILAPHQLIGNSNNGLPEALVSTAQPVDYLAVGRSTQPPLWVSRAARP